MTLDRILRWVLFCAGIITAIFAGYMFSEAKIDWGAAWLSVSVGFLCFATRVKADKPSASSSDTTAMLFSLNKVYNSFSKSKL